MKGYIEERAVEIANYIVEKNDNKFLMYCDYSNDTTYKNYLVKDNSVIKLGSSPECNICIKLSNILPEHLKINYLEGKWSVELIENAVCYINDKKIKSNKINCNNGIKEGKNEKKRY